MYANFELCREGWVTADIERKHRRSVTGCLPCRQRKKKCDESWPVCKRCTRYNDQANCHPPYPKDPTRSKPTAPPSVASPNSTDFVASPNWTQSDSSSPASADHSHSGNNECRMILPSSINLVPEGAERLPSCSLADLFMIFNPASHALDLGPQSSIIFLTMPLTTRLPAVFHAMTSCSSIFLSQKQPSWHSVAVHHHCKALQTLSAALSEQDTLDPDLMASSMAVVMMLHLFEKFDPMSQTTSHTHLSAAQEIFFRAFSSRPPRSTLGTLVLEAFIHHTAVNSTFHPEFVKDYDYLETMVALCAASPAQHDSGFQAFRRSLWAELPPELFDCIYKISFLRRKVPLSGAHWFEAVGINQRLKCLCLPGPTRGRFSSMKPQGQDDVATYHVRRLYVAAAQLILFKIMNLSVEAADPRVQALLNTALEDILTLGSASPILMYPVAVVGTAAIEGQTQQQLVLQLERMRYLSGNREVDSIRKFWARAWASMDEPREFDNARSSYRPLQLDILLDDRLLHPVTI